MTDAAYLERVYAGIIGKTAGVRLGAPVEPTIWSYDRIHAVYGEITSYVRDYKNFAADDDLNGPLFFIRALPDYCTGKGLELSSEMVGNAWLNYSREGKGMFWWGGYGRSAEHTAYVHLKSGIAPPLSGSIQLSGPVIPQQIGGQIFIDTWGLIAPGDPKRAADLAGTAAQVAHDGVGVEGARFVAAAIAVAFGESRPGRIVEQALGVLDTGSELVRMIREIVSFHAEHRSDFRACRGFVEKNFGYWKYPGVCPLPTNAAVIVLALLYGDGDFGRTIEIATMCGWDTDCNAGNAGTIAGVAYGLKSIPDRYRTPINDVIVASSISGSLNIIDIPSVSAFIAGNRYALEKREAPDCVNRQMPRRELYFPFDLDGSTHGFRLSDSLHFQLRQTKEHCKDGIGGSLEILVDRLERGQVGRIYHKPWYRRSDFDDERYDPAFSPLVYPGQVIGYSLAVSIMSGKAIRVAPYASADGTLYEGAYTELAESDMGTWTDQLFTIPDTGGAPIDEVGILIMNFSKEKFLGHVYLDHLAVSGPGSFEVDFSKQTIEFGTVTQCTTNGGAWSLEEGCVRASSVEAASLYTGNYYSSDYTVSGRVRPIFGESHMIMFRSRGAMMGYYFGLHGDGTVALLKNDHGIELLQQASFNWMTGEEYELVAEARGRTFICSVGDQQIFAYEEMGEYYEHGMVGYHHGSAGNTLFGTITVNELEKE